MDKKNMKARKRKNLLQKRQSAKKHRTAVQPNGETTTVIRQSALGGYDIEMIRDFLDHLLLEVRAQHFENIKVLRTLKDTGHIEQSLKAADEPSPVLIEQFVRLQKKYPVALLAANAIDPGGVTDPGTIKAYMRAFLETNIEKRDVQIGHLEGLQELFGEALLCAKLPFGVTHEGKPVQPLNVYSIRDSLNEGMA